MKMKRDNSFFLGAAFVFLSLLIGVLGFRVHQLKDLVNDLRPQPRAGDWVPPYQTTTLDGSSVVLGTPKGQFQILYFFSPTCAICRQTEPKIAELYNRVASSHEPIEIYDLSALPVEQLRSYSTSGRGAYPLIQLESRKMVSLINAHSVPTVVVVDKEG